MKIWQHTLYPSNKVRMRMNLKLWEGGGKIRFVFVLFVSMTFGEVSYLSTFSKMWKFQKKGPKSPPENGIPKKRHDKSLIT